MLFELQTLDPDAFADPQVVIIGAGAVGLTMAVDLARRGRRVLLLESGPRHLTKQSQSFIETASWEGFPLVGLHLGRVRALGGTTNLWGGQLVPMEPAVFQERPWFGEVDWPIREAELTPHYQRAFELLGMESQIGEDREIWRRLKVNPPKNSADIELFFTRWAPEPNFARLYEGDINKNPNLGVVIEAQVAALDIRGDTSVGVKAKTSTGRELAFSAPTVVLANGTVEIVRLLQLPLCDGQTPPWGNNSWLGKAFLDHIDCYAGAVRPLDKSRIHEVFDNAYVDGIKYSPKLRLGLDAQLRDRTASIAGHFLFNSSIAEHAAFAKVFFKSLLRGRMDADISAVPRELLSMIRIAIPMVHRYLRHSRMYNLADRGIQLRLTAEQRPMADSRISLTQKKDALGIPCVKVNWSVDDEEILTLGRFAEMVADYLSVNGLATVELDPRLKSRDPSFLKDIDDANHQMGGARMGRFPSDGVVDSDLRVFGTRNLFVAGAAVYPSTGFPNPTFAAIALGLRLASKLRENLL